MPTHTLGTTVTLAELVTQKHAAATWFKLLVAVVSILVALVVFKLVFAYPGTIFLDPFWSFVTVVLLSVALYYVALILLRRTGRHHPAGSA